MSELPSLLFRQRLLFALLAGSVSVRDAALGVALLFLLLVIPGREKTLRRALMAAFFLLGCGLTFLASPKAPDTPSWAAVPGKYVLAEGRVASATGLPGGRVRVLLEELHPLPGLPEVSDETAEAVRKALSRRPPASIPGSRKDYPGGVVPDEASPVPGLVSLTLYADDIGLCGRPVPGQRLRALLRLYPVTGSVNPGTSDLGAYWADRDVWHNARPGRDREGLIFSGAGGRRRRGLSCR